jgi:branched-chain amino acid transport system ATP-binding protein
MTSAETSAVPALSVKDAVLRFGGITAVASVSFEVEEGSTFGIIGPNGAGKTALLNCINGIYRLNSGSIHVFGEQIDGLPPHRIAGLGLSRTFQSTEHFKRFTVIDYVMLGRARVAPCSVLGSMVMWPWRERSEKAERKVAMKVLETMGLDRHASEHLAGLPYGVQKQVDIARAVAAGPRIMLMDEPSSGVTTSERDALAHSVRTVAETGVTIVLIDHDVDFVTRHCDQVLVVSYGRPIGTGTPDEMLRKPEVIEAFLGSATPGSPLAAV